MKKSKGGFIGGFIMGVASVVGGYFAYKFVKPDYIKDYEETDDYDKDDDLDDFEYIDESEEK